MKEPVGFSEMFPYYQIVTAIAIVLVLIPIPAHLKAGNIATVALGFWNLGGNIIALVNTLIWRGNMRNAYIWGDITSFYFLNMGLAVSSCTLSIVHRLWNVARTQTALISKEEKRRQLYLAYFLCLGVPLLQGVLHIVVQGHRYNIFEDLGPLGTTYQTPLTFAIFFIFEPLVTLISAIYCALTVHLFLKKRREFDRVFGSQSAHLTKNSYVRFLALGAVGISIHLPISTFVILVNATVFHTNPWISWDDTHSNFGRIGYFNRFIVDSTPYSKHLTELSFCLIPASGILYFCFFGFGEDATRQYKTIVGILLKPFGVKYPKEVKGNGVIVCRPMRPYNPYSNKSPPKPPVFFPPPSLPESRSYSDSHTAVGDTSIDTASSQKFDVNELQTSSYPHSSSTVPSSGIQTRRHSIGSSIHDSSDKDQGAGKVNQDKTMAGSETGADNNEKTAQEMTMDVTNQCQSEKTNEKEKIELTDSFTAGSSQTHIEIPDRDIEAQDSPGTSTSTSIEEARTQFRETNPTLTEKVTF